MLAYDIDQIVPAGHLILVELLPLEEKKGSLYIPPDPTDRRRDEIARQVGIIIAMGPSAFDGRAVIDDTIKVGTKVLFERYAGKHFELPDRDVRLLRDTDIDGKIIPKKS